MEIVREACLVFDTYVKEVSAAGKFRNLDNLECKVNRSEQGESRACLSVCTAEITGQVLVLI